MSMSSDRGRRGEAIARLFLEDCGYRCLASRYRLPGGELDLIMDAPGVMVFVEVKVSGPGGLSNPCERVNPRKLVLMHRMARQYLHRNPGREDVWLRFDVVGIRIQGDGLGLKLTHLCGVG